MRRLLPKHRLPLISGCTASGKSELAICVAEELRQRGFDSPAIINCDALQVYRGLEIGAAKVSAADRRRVPHHLLDVVDPTVVYDVKQWEEAARSLVNTLPTPVVAGGSHMYMRILLQGTFPRCPTNAAFRARITDTPTWELHEWLRLVDPVQAKSVHRNDRSRIERGLEVFETTGEPISTQQSQWSKDNLIHPTLLVHIDTPRALLNRRINKRVNSMVEEGLVDEVRGLWEQGMLGPGARAGIGYDQLVRHFEGHCTLDKAVELVKIATRRLAKQQRKWVRKLSSIEGMRVLALRDGEWDAHPELATIPTGKPPPPDIVALGDELLERPLPWEKWAAQVADILESEELQ